MSKKTSMQPDNEKLANGVDLTINSEPNEICSLKKIESAENAETHPVCCQAEKKQPIKRKIIFSITAFVFTFAAVLFLIFLPKALYRDGARGGIAIAGTVTSIITIYVLLMCTLFTAYFYKFGERKKETKFFTTKNITRTAIFSALAIVLYYYIKFPVPTFFPGFLDFQFSDLPALLAGYMMGPFSGAIVIVIKFLVKLPASSTSGVGEVIDLILGLSFVITATLIYRKNKSLKGAIISLAIGSLVCTLTAALANRFIAVPAYVVIMFNGDWSILLNAMNSIFNGKVTQSNFYWYYIFLSIIPFNLLRCFITSLLTFLLYKNLKKLFDKLSV